MSRWVCPQCGREFGIVHQAHTCRPGCSLEDVFEGHPSVYRAIYDAIIAHLAQLGPIHTDIVSVGVFLKCDAKFAEIRPRARWLSLELVLPQPIEDRRVARHVRLSESRTVHMIKLDRVEEVDDQVCGWLTEAYLFATR
jgi:hypothetical protein